MSGELTPPTRSRQPHYSFMRPGDFIWFILLLTFTAWKFWIAYGHLADRFFMQWISYAAISLLLVIWYAWIRVRRRQAYGDSGEVMIAGLVPQAYIMLWQHYNKGDDLLDWSLFWIFTLLLISSAYRVWKAPKLAKEQEEQMAAVEEAAKNTQAGLPFNHIENP